MKRRNRFSSILGLFLSLAMVFQGPAMAQIEISIPIDIEVKITTHPDDYNTKLPLIMASPVVGDLDCDWVLDIVGAGYDEDAKKSYIYVWHRNGVVQTGWPKEIDGRIENIPALGDLDGDGDLEIVVSVSKNPPDKGGWVYVWHHDGLLYNGYPMELDYKPGAPLVGDVTDGFEEEPIVYESNMSMAICDIDLDGKKEVIIASPFGVDVLNSDDIKLEGWPVSLLTIGNIVAGDVDGDGKPEIFLAIKTPDANYIYGWHNDGSAIEGWPVNIAGVVNAPGSYLSIADIDKDGISEVLSGSNNGWIAGWRLGGQVAFSAKPTDSPIYQPIVGDIDNDGDMEILATSKSGNIYCYDKDGNPVQGWPYKINSTLSPGAVLVDIDMDSIGDPVNPLNDLELLFSASDGMVHSIDLPGDFHPNDIQWGMNGYNNRNTNNYLRDWDTSGWFIFDNDPEGATITSVYDWTRGGRVIELKGAGLNNCYVYKKPDGKPFNSKNTTLQWSMRYNLPFNIYVSIDTIKGKRFLYYTPTEGNQPKEGNFIHHGLGGGAKDGRWHTYSRQLVLDLKDAEPDNEIVDINAIYIQGSGRIDDVMLLKGMSCGDIVNLALNADVEVSSGEGTKGNINDGDPDTVWVSDDSDLSWIKYTWDTPQRVNKIVIENVHGAKSGVIFITDSKGNVYEIDFEVPEDGSPIVIVFPAIDDVKSIVVVFDNENGPVSVGEIGVYNDPNVEEEGELPEEEYSSDKYIRMKDGYFFDPVKNTPWIPHGISYQTWNKALGQWQSPSELKNDLDMMKEAGANALRVDFVWKHIEIEDGVYDFSRCDMLLEEAQARGMKVFPIIGYQWPPDWFPKEWYTMHPPNEKHPDGPWLSDILSYEDPEVLKQFSDFLQAVVKRYSVGGVREDLGDTVAGWILGNEYGYLGLWSVEYDGYDEDCQNAFRQWLEAKYNGDIGALNARWAKDNIATPGYLPNYPYNNFSEVDMPIPFGYQGDTKGKYLARDKASWYDLTQWREASIAKFVALAAKAVRDVDSWHLISYAAVGMQWGEEDWRYHTEDARKIAEACKDIGAPLDFWSINNYPWGLENSELMTGQWGIERARHDTGLPVMVTETGFTDTETMYPGITTERQAKLVRNAIWEALESGAIGVCVFHWNDREQPGLTMREKGFGIVTKDKTPKPAYFAVKDAFKKMEQLDIAQFLVGSKGPKPDIAFLWDDAVDTIVNRYEAEMKELYGTLERLGYEPTFINDKELLDGLYIDYKAIVLPRNQKMFDWTFDLLDDIVSSGVKLHADSDVPGLMDEYGQPRDKITWLLTMKDLFGIDATNCGIDPNLEDNVYVDGYEMSSFWPINWGYKPKRVIYPGLGFDKTLNMWKYRDKILADGGVVKAVFDNPNGNPALVSHFDTAISLFSLGDCKPIDNAPYSDWTWSDRYDWVKSIYMAQDVFNIQPELYISNKYVLVDYRVCADGSVLLSFKNYRPDSEETTTVTTSLIIGKTVKDLLTDELVEENCDGTVQRTLPPDGHDLLLAFNLLPPQQNPDFKVNATPKSQNVNPGESTSYTVEITSIDGFNSPVKLKVTGLPEGAFGVFASNEVIPPSTTILNISTLNSILPNTYSLTIKGTSEGKTRQSTVKLVVNELPPPPPPVPDFELSVTPQSNTIEQGGSAVYTINISSVNGFNTPVTLNVAGLPAGASGVFSPEQIIPPGSVTLKITTEKSVVPKTYSLNIEGTGGNKTKSISVGLVIEESQQSQDLPDFGLTVTPASQTIKQGESTSYTVELTSIKGFNSPVTLKVTGLPSGADGVFNINPFIPPGKTTLDITTNSSVNPGTYNLKVEGTGGGITHSNSIKLTVNNKDIGNQGQQEPQWDTSNGPNNQSSSLQSSASSTSSQESNSLNQKGVQAGNTSSQVSTLTTSSLENTDDTKGSSGIKPAYGPVIILEKDKKEKKGSNLEQREGGSPSKGSSINLGVRTYVGSGYHTSGSSSTEPSVQEVPPIPEVPPVEQFQKAIEEAIDKEMGIIRVKPQIVPSTRLEDVINRPKQEPKKPVIKLDIPKIIDMWISAFKKWWQDLVKRFQFAFNKSTTKRYA